jgi:hypothetical protein
MTASRSGALTRDSATRRVMKTIARTFDHETLPLVLPDGSRPIVVALPNETISEVVSRVMSIGGRANVAVAFADRFQTFVMNNNASTSLKVIEITQDISVGYFLIRLEQNPGKSMRLKFRDVDADVPVVTVGMAYAA